jgi:membrane protein YqaA with SNARE-associated domain
MEFLVDFGYFGLFLAAFLAATILPLSSELVLTALLLNDLAPEMLILVATIGNVLGSLTNYGIGYWASKGIIQQWLKMSEQEFVKAEERFQKYGLFSLLFAWVPVIGDPLTVIAGILRVNLVWFIILVTLGKLTRYVIVSYLILESV